MKRKVTKILGIVLLFMIIVNTYCYADLINPNNPGLINPDKPSTIRTVGDTLSDLLTMGIVILAVATIVTISVIVLVKSKKTKEEIKNESEKE